MCVTALSANLHSVNPRGNYSTVLRIHLFFFISTFKDIYKKDADMDMHEAEIMCWDDTPIQDYESYAAAFPARLEHQ